jgi:hypothetical protein
MARVRTRRTSISLVLLIWIIVGIVVAIDRGYISVALLRMVLSALLAIFLWPLVLLGVNLRVT